MGIITGNRKGRITLVTFLALLAGALYINFWMVGQYVLTVCVGAFLALLSKPVYNRLRKRHNLGPKISATLVTLGIVLLVIAPIILFSVISVKQAISIWERVSQDGFSFQSVLEKVQDWEPVNAVFGSAANIESQLRRWMQGAGQSLSGGALAVVANIPEILLRLALASLSCFFLLIDGRRFVNWAWDRIPVDGDVRAQLIQSFQDTTISVTYATIAAALVQAGLMLGGFLVLGVPAAFLAAGATFIFAWIPMIGSVPVWTVGAIYLYSQGSIGKMIAMLVIGAFTSVADNLVRPLVLKGRSDMHPLVSLVAIFGGIQVFGLLGVFFGPIMAAALISLLQIWPQVGKSFGIDFDSRASKIGDLGTPKFEPGQGKSSEDVA